MVVLLTLVQPEWTDYAPQEQTNKHYYEHPHIWKHNDTSVTKLYNAVQLNEPALLKGPIRNEACLCESFLLVRLRYSILVKQIEKALPKKSFETGLATRHDFSLILQAVYCRREYDWKRKKENVLKSIHSSIKIRTWLLTADSWTSHQFRNLFCQSLYYLLFCLILFDGKNYIYRLHLLIEGMYKSSERCFMFNWWTVTNGQAATNIRSLNVQDRQWCSGISQSIVIRSPPSTPKPLEKQTWTNLHSWNWLDPIHRQMGFRQRLKLTKLHPIHRLMGFR